MVILEFGGAFPWVRRHLCPVPVLRPAVKGAHPRAHMPRGHATWVKLRDGRIGWLHHHDSNDTGWVVQHPDGSQSVAQSSEWTLTEEPK